MSDEPTNPDSIAKAIRQKAVQSGAVSVALILEIEDALRHFPDSVSLWVLRGDLIQLAEHDRRWSLEDVESSYLKAAALQLSNPLPLESLGYFYDCVLNDPAGAESFFRRSIKLGAGASARKGLRDVLKQLK